MPELMIDVITSLDGYASADGWPGLWGLGGPDYFAYLEQDAMNDDTVLMGAATYRLFASFAASGEEDMAALTAMDKIVFSSTLDEPLGWGNTRLTRGSAVDSVGQLKQDGNRSLRTVGSPTLCRSLLRAGLVDRLRVVVFPVVTGASGRDPFYSGWPDVALDTVDHRTFDGRLQLIEYVPRILDAPPS